MLLTGSYGNGPPLFSVAFALPSLCKQWKKDLAALSIRQPIFLELLAHPGLFTTDGEKDTMRGKEKRNGEGRRKLDDVRCGGQWGRRRRRRGEQKNREGKGEGGVKRALSY